MDDTIVLLFDLYNCLLEVKDINKKIGNKILTF